MRQATAAIRLGIALGALLLSVATALAQSAAPDNTLPYRNVFQTSQVIFDQCGDVARGDLYRKVVREKVEHCPFSDAEKASFRTWADARSTIFAAQNAQAAAGGAVPGTPEEQHRCKALAATPAMRLAVGRIDRYGRGQASADDVIEEVCRPYTP